MYDSVSPPVPTPPIPTATGRCYPVAEVQPAPSGLPDNREAVPDRAIGRLSEGLFEDVGVGVGKLDSDYGEAAVGCWGSLPHTNETASSSL
jgi:hypothetical protein